jgi:protocatechuate 3,4-dioxygenase, alpha subunit
MTSLPLTPSQTVGPYFRIGLEWLFRADLTGPGVAGPRVAVSGRILDGEGVPVDDALLELWQADPAGRYARPEGGGPGDQEFSGFARIAVDAAGGFRFTTVKPGRVPGLDGRVQAPHLAVTIFMRGLLRHLVTRVYFPDEAEANAADPVLTRVEPGRRATLVARPAPAHVLVPELVQDPGGGAALCWDVHLQGPQETVFFDC